jgi:hypothetical protein
MDRADDWLIRASSLEIRAQRVFFLAVLCPVLGLLSPCLLMFVSLSILVVAVSSALGQPALEQMMWSTLIFAFSAAMAIGALLTGSVRERRAVLQADRLARQEPMPLPPELEASLRDRFDAVWQALPVKTSPRAPTLIVQPSWDVTAHAYDDPKEGMAVEISSGLASRVLANDPLGAPILRHEATHLVFRDLRMIRLQSIWAAGSLFSAYFALAICALVAVALLAVSMVKPWPIPKTVLNGASVALAIVLATLIVAAPLLLGVFVLRRYAGLLVALIEMRADVCAGLWGRGLEEFTDQIRRDRTVRTSGIVDLALAYISPSLSHFPAIERIALMSSAQRFTTPKLRYLLAAVLVIWLLQFHQGNEVWDFLLLSISVAFTWGLTVYMVANAPIGMRLRWRDALALALGLLALQALPLISIEGVAYLVEHLTAAIITPGGYGPSDDIHYWRDVLDVMGEFTRFVRAATGGWMGGAGVILVAVALWLLPRLQTVARHHRSLIASGVGCVASLVVSYQFFQTHLAHPVRLWLIRFSQLTTDGALHALSPTLGRTANRVAWTVSEFFFGAPILGGLPWLRLAVPAISSVVVAAVLSGFARGWRFDRRGLPRAGLSQDSRK